MFRWNRAPYGTNNDNNDVQVSKDSVESAPAEDVFDRMVSTFSNGKETGKEQLNYRLLGKRLRVRYPQQLAIENLKQVYYRDPIAFIKILHEISPFFKSTVDLYLMMATSGKFNIDVSVDGDIDNDLSKEAEDFWENQPIDVGNLQTLIGKLLLEFCFFADGCAFQGIGYEGDEAGEEGYAYVKPFSTNDVLIGKNELKQVGLYQLSKSGKRIELNMAHTFWKPHNPTLESPGGTYAMTSGIIEGLAEIIGARDLRDGVRGAGSPIRKYRYDRDALIKTAVETLGMTIRAKERIAQFIEDQIASMENYAKNRKNAESLVIAKDVDVSNVEPADFGKVIPALDQLFIRAAASWGTHTNMLGQGEATKQGLQYQLVAQRVDFKREMVLDPIEKCTEKHFLLKGIVAKVKIRAPKIHLTDQLVAENTRQMQFLNELLRYATGLTDHEQFSRNVTGESPKGEPLEGAVDAILKIAKTGGADNNGSNDAKNTGGKPGKPPEK